MKRLLGIVPALALALAALATPAPAQADEALLQSACGGCHARTDSGLSRIAGQRKSPEGWLMTIVRMRVAHGMEIASEDQAALVSYLSDTRGLAPSETAGWRYGLEKEPDAIEQIDEPLASMCARCHTGARVALQRRTAEEWDLHMDFHVGQFPTVEYQALGRDREWFRIAKAEIAPMLAAMYPLETDAWTAWQAAPKPAVAGDWVVLTELPQRGQAYGRLTVTGVAPPYAMAGEMRLADGTELAVSGRMNLYTGFEWRADLAIGNERYRQVLAVSEDGARLEGRQFRRDADSLGAPLIAAKTGGAPAILGAVPRNAAPGSAAVQVVGVGIEGLTAAGAEFVSGTGNAFGIRAVLRAPGDAAVTLRAQGAETAFSFYETIDRLAVEPGFAIARVGGGSAVGPEAVPAHFRAIAYWNGPDGLPETADDIRIGEVPAEWSVGNAGEAAEAMDDAAFAGGFEGGGIFVPAVAGPNPARPFSTNNAGDLEVIAAAKGLTAASHLIVTVQRFIDPPIR